MRGAFGTMCSRMAGGVTRSCIRCLLTSGVRQASAANLFAHRLAIEGVDGMDLTYLRREAKRSGWVTSSGDIETVRSTAARLGWQEVATRKGDPAVAELRPTNVDDAHPQSLSAIHGLGAQPLHTDGAHLRRPPDLVILAAQEPSGTPTMLWSSSAAASSSSKLTNPINPWLKIPAFMVGGLFVVRGGAETFLASAYSTLSGLRYDPGCMAPCDERARRAMQFFEDALTHAYRHEWSTASQLLIIDNRSTLHARAAVDASDNGRVLRRVCFYIPEEK
ncbi:TauD/TfdA family dioxygenase [Micromonospora chalcea]